MKAPWILMLAVLAGGCVSGSFPADGAARAAVDLPASFLVSDGGELRPALPDEGCRNPMVDPRDGTVLTLVRSLGARGDYEPADRRYGDSPNELLRLDCSTGRPVGIVPR